VESRFLWGLRPRPNGLSVIDGRDGRTQIRHVATSRLLTFDSVMDPLINRARAAIERRDWLETKALLHPYLHWAGIDGRTIRGRNNVLAYLAATPPSDPPERYEIRDGQIYRWIE
jgi:hypothetical protein